MRILNCLLSAIIGTALLGGCGSHAQQKATDTTASAGKDATEETQHPTQATRERLEEGKVQTYEQAEPTGDNPQGATEQPDSNQPN
jgi:hypothetical protein